MPKTVTYLIRYPISQKTQKNKKIKNQFPISTADVANFQDKCKNAKVRSKVHDLKATRKKGPVGRERKNRPSMESVMHYLHNQPFLFCLHIHFFFPIFFFADTHTQNLHSNIHTQDTQLKHTNFFSISLSSLLSKLRISFSVPFFNGNVSLHWSRSQPQLLLLLLLLLLLRFSILYPFLFFAFLRLSMVAPPCSRRFWTSLCKAAHTACNGWQPLSSLALCCSIAHWVRFNRSDLCYASCSGNHWCFWWYLHFFSLMVMGAFDWWLIGLVVWFSNGNGVKRVDDNGGFDLLAFDFDWFIFLWSSGLLCSVWLVRKCRKLKEA